LRAREGIHDTADCYALRNLSKCRIAKLRVQLRLPDEDDLKQFVGIRLEVGEQAEVFERFRGQILGFVDDQGGGGSLAQPNKNVMKASANPALWGLSQGTPKSRSATRKIPSNESLALET
jgi:hypothetical protein